MTRKSQEPRHDPIYEVADLLGDAWSWMILREAIFDRVTRFDEFQRRLGVGRKILAKRLEMLTAAGLFVRRHIREGGARLEYVLTEMGRHFFICLVTAQRWGDRSCRERGNTTRHAVHVPFGHRLEAVLCCSECGQVLKARDVAVVSIYRASSELIGARRQRAPDLDMIARSQSCSIVRTLQVIGDRWSSLVIRECFLGTRRFGAFEQHLGIAPNILASRLERLIGLGVLMKTSDQKAPMRHEYRLTEKGLDLYAVPLASLTWGERWLSSARSRTDLRHTLCGKRFIAVPTCATCGDKISVDDVALAPSGHPSERR